MTKEEQIFYLNKIRPFINLQAVCNDYNEKCDKDIDYNNLRTVLKDPTSKRLSSDKLDSFIEYLYKYLYPEIFQTNNKDYYINRTVVYDIASSHAKNMADAIVKEIESEFCTKL